MMKIIILNYKNYDKLRLIIVNIFNLIFNDIKNGKRKNKEKVDSLMNIFNNTYMFINFPKDKYLYKFYIFVKNKLFYYYKDYIFKAKMEYEKKEIPWAAEIIIHNKKVEVLYDPFKLKYLYITFKQNINDLIYVNTINNINY